SGMPRRVARSPAWTGPAWPLSRRTSGLDLPPPTRARLAGQTAGRPSLTEPPGDASSTDPRHVLAERPPGARCFAGLPERPGRAEARPGIGADDAPHRG